jgi:AcrR family transcriptional regulator
VNSDSSSEPTRQSLRDRLREATNREILAAAERVFAEQGLDKASMAQIAERAGVAVGTLYNRFEDRDALLEAVLSDRRAELLEKLDRAAATAAGAAFRAQLVSFFATLFGHFDEHQAFLRLVLASEVGPREKRAQMSRALLERLEAILKRGQRDKSLRRDPGGTFAPFLLAAGKSIVHRADFGLPPLPNRESAEQLVTLFLEGAGR